MHWHASPTQDAPCLNTMQCNVFLWRSCVHFQSNCKHIFKGCCSYGTVRSLSRKGQTCGKLTRIMKLKIWENMSLWKGQYKKGERKAFNPPAAVVIFPGYDETCDPDLLHTKRYTRRRRREVEGGGRKVCGDISGYVCSFP